MLLVLHEQNDWVAAYNANDQEQEFPHWLEQHMLQICKVYCKNKHNQRMRIIHTPGINEKNEIRHLKCQNRTILLD